jgi:hypothetical protein
MVSALKRSKRRYGTNIQKITRAIWGRDGDI